MNNIHQNQIDIHQNLWNSKNVDNKTTSSWVVELEPTYLKKIIRQNWDSLISTPFLLGGGVKNHPPR